MSERYLGETYEDTASLADLADEELALAFQGGDEGAFDTLVHRHQQRVFAVAYRITSNREDARDVAQEALIKAHGKIDAWRPTGSFRAWLLRLTANTAIDWHRKKVRRGLVDYGDDHVNRSAPDTSPLRNTGDAVAANEIEERVQEALALLSPSQRTVFVMRHYEGLPLVEIAEALECSPGSVKVHLFRALQKLRPALRDLYDPNSEEE